MFPAFLLTVVPILSGFLVAVITYEFLGIKKANSLPGGSLMSGIVSSVSIAQHYKAPEEVLFIAFVIGGLLGWAGWLLFGVVFSSTE